MAETAATVWTRVVVIVASSLATVAFVLVTFVGSEYLRRVSTLEAMVTGMGISIAQVLTEVEQHNKLAGEYINQIHENQQVTISNERALAGKRVKIANLEGQMATLSARVDALYSPGGPAKRFTSDDGNRHYQLIMELHTELKDLTKRVHECERCCDHAVRQ